MSHKQAVLSIFRDEIAAHAAVSSLKAWDGISHEAKLNAIGILVLDETGSIKTHRVGSHSLAKGAGIGLVLAVLVPPLGLGTVVTGGVLGALHRKGLGLTQSDRDRIAAELASGKAAVGVLARDEQEAGIIARKLEELGGTTEAHAVSNEAIEQMTAARLPPGSIDRYHVVPGGHLRWLVCDREGEDEAVAAEQSYELAQGKADELNRESPGRDRRT